MAHKPHARVAHRTTRRIDEVDGVPNARTEPGTHHAWTVTDGHDAAAPLPFAAKATVPANVAVTAMCVLVLIATTVALVTILDGHEDTALIVLALMGGLLAWTAGTG